MYNHIYFAPELEQLELEAAAILCQSIEEYESEIVNYDE